MTSTVPVSANHQIFFAQAELDKRPAFTTPEEVSKTSAPRTPAVRPAPFFMRGMLRFQPLSNIQMNVDRNMKLLEQARIKAQDDAKKRVEIEAETNRAKQSVPFFQGDVNQGYNPHVDCSRGRR